jgi:predicted dehydrogenase
VRTWRVVGLSFEHMHMPALLRLVQQHPSAEIVGLCDPIPSRMSSSEQEFGMASSQLFTDVDRCMDSARPDLVILCSAPSNHAPYIEAVSRYGAHVLIDKPFATNLRDADEIIRVMPGRKLAINWPLAWYPPHITAKRLISEKAIGTVTEVHYYGGNRGPLYHRNGGERDADGSEKASSWWYSQDAGGGSLLDYLGYGATLGTWFMDGAVPREVSTLTRRDPSLEVEDQSVTLVRYDHGISVFGTRWGTLTDPWLCQTQPKNGFVIVGTDGTIASADYADTIMLQTRRDPEIKQVPVDEVQPPYRNPVEYILHCIDTGADIEGPLSPAISRIGQQMIDAAIQSAEQGRAIRVTDDLPLPQSD